MKKIFGEIDLTWKKLIISAVKIESPEGYKEEFNIHIGKMTYSLNNN